MTPTGASNPHPTITRRAHYLAPIAIASHSMGLSLARLSQHWGLGFQASDSGELLDAMRENMYRFGSDLAFS